MVRVVEALTEVMKDHVMSGYDTVMWETVSEWDRVETHGSMLHSLQFSTERMSETIDAQIQTWWFVACNTVCEM